MPSNTQAPTCLDRTGIKANDLKANNSIELVCLLIRKDLHRLWCPRLLVASKKNRIPSDWLRTSTIQSPFYRSLPINREPQLTILSLLCRAISAWMSHETLMFLESTSKIAHNKKKFFTNRPKEEKKERKLPAHQQNPWVFLQENLSQKSPTSITKRKNERTDERKKSSFNPSSSRAESLGFCRNLMQLWAMPQSRRRD